MNNKENNRADTDVRVSKEGLYFSCSAKHNRICHRTKKSVLRSKLTLFWLRYTQHFQNVISNRRHALQRMLRQQEMLRTFCMKRLLKIESDFLKLLPLSALSKLYVEHLQEEDTGCRKKRNLRSNENYICGVIMEDATISHSADTKYEQIQSFENILLSYTEEQWQKTFHFSRRAFHWLFEQLFYDLQQCVAYKDITVEKLMALGLYILATGANENVVAKLFQIKNPNDIIDFFALFINTLLAKLAQKLLVMPHTEAEYKEICGNFRSISNMPSCVGVLGVCQIGFQRTASVQSGMITLPDLKSLSGSPVASEKQEAGGFLLQAVIDDKLLFRKVQLDLNKPEMLLEAPNAITKLGMDIVDGHCIRYFVVPPPSEYYPLQSWLMQKFHLPVANHEIEFNKCFDKLQLIKDEAFKHLFARFYILHRKIDYEVSLCKNIILACCVLHNLFEENDFYCEDWSLEQPNADQYAVKFDLFKERHIINKSNTEFIDNENEAILIGKRKKIHNNLMENVEYYQKDDLFLKTNLLKTKVNAMGFEKVEIPAPYECPNASDTRSFLAHRVLEAKKKDND